MHPFAPAQIKLMETFADQAVIAIENVRLFQAFKESWSSRPRRARSGGHRQLADEDSARVNVVAENAARLCDATDAMIYAASRARILPRRGPMEPTRRPYNIGQGRASNGPWLGSRPSDH